MRILIVGPRFHGYNSAAAKALEALGHEVVVHDYDRPEDLPGRLRNKAVHDLPERYVPSGWRGEPARRAIARLRQVRPQALLIMKGDLLGSDWWEAALESGIPMVTWFYDELDRMAFPDQLVEAMPAIASYSGPDAAALRQRGMRALHLPLAFDALQEFEVQPLSTVSFIGARYQKRVELLSDLAARGVPVRAYGRDWSRSPLDIVSTRKLPVRGVASGSQLDRRESYGVMAGSLASINTHSNQQGFTMRTFEVAGVGGLELIDREDVSELYEPGREVLVFRSPEELAELVQRARRDPEWAHGIRERARLRTAAEHTFVHRMKEVEALWG